MKELKMKIKDFLKNHCDKIKEFLKIFTIVFALNLFLLSFVNLITNGTETDVFYGGDTPRVLQDMTMQEGLHYRTSVHPLFVILTQPFIRLLGRFTGVIVAAVIFEAAIGALSATLFYRFMQKLGVSKKTSLTATVILTLSFTQIAFNSIFETYAFSQFGLMVMWVIAAGLIDKKLELKDYALLAVAGIFSLAFTLTNIVQFLILLSIIIFLNKNVKCKFIKFSSVLLVVLSITVMLADIQKSFWPSANNFFTSSINGFLLDKNSEEFTYIERTWSIKRVIFQMNTSFVYQFGLLGGLTLEKNNLINVLGLASFGLFSLINFYYFFAKRKIFKEKFYFALLFAYGFNFVLHIFYNPYESFLYVLHYNFLIIAILFYIFTHLDEKTKFLNYVRDFFVKYKIQTMTTYIFLQVIGIIKYLQEVHAKFGFKATMPKYILILMILSLVIFAALMIKKIKFKVVAGVVIVIVSLVGWVSFSGYLNNREIKNVEALDRAGVDYKPFLRNDFTKQMTNELAEYLYELDVPLRAQTYFIQKYEISHKKNSDFFSFGMGDRKKLIYKKGKLIDLQTKQTVRSFDFTHEMIIPNMYTVLLLDQAGKITRIYEDETGVHIEKGRMARIWEDWNNYNQWEDDRLNNRETKLVENITTETISTSKNKINLPNFEESKVGRILKVLHQEILVNINQGKPRTTLMAKTNESGLYREGMMAAMVLEETKNTWLFENWMKQIGSIYDCRNKLEKNEPKCVESADNPGQLLYLLGAITNNRQDLINKIRTEVKQKAIDGEFTGKVDEEEMGYYPTALLINGGRKNRIELGYDFNLGKPDKYLGLTWWLNDYKEAKHGNIVDPMHPAKEWASVHQEPGHYGLTTILDEAYPLTFDGELTEAEAEEQKLINEHYSHEKGPRLSSIWHASEMFLMLNNRE